jgi:hypothetical protein
MRTHRDVPSSVHDGTFEATAARGWRTVQENNMSLTGHFLQNEFAEDFVTHPGDGSVGLGSQTLRARCRKMPKTALFRRLGGVMSDVGIEYTPSLQRPVPSGSASTREAYLSRWGRQFSRQMIECGTSLVGRMQIDGASPVLQFFPAPVLFRRPSPVAAGRWTFW